jgi:uncharacterized protein YqeY
LAYFAREISGLFFFGLFISAPFHVSSLKKSLQADMKAALRSGEKERLAVLRMALAAIQRREVDERIELDDGAVLKIIEKLVKQGQESARQFAEGGRDDLVQKELAEVKVLQAYLPEPLSEAELDTLIADAIASTGAESLRDMGKVMNAIRETAQGRADMGTVGGRVKKKLAG